MEQERDVVACYVEVALVGLGHPGQLVEILDNPVLGIMHDAAILPKAHSSQFIQRRPSGVTGDLVIEFQAHDQIDG